MNFKWNNKWCIKTSSNVNQNCSACPARNFLYQMPEAKRPLFLAKWHFAGKLVWIAVVNVSCQKSKDSRLFSKQYRNARTVDFLKVRLVEAIYSYFEKGCRKNVHATIPRGNMGYVQYTVPDDCSCRTYFCCFPLALTDVCPWPPLPFFQISLKNSELKTTHNTFRGCRVRFFRQLFSK